MAIAFFEQLKKIANVRGMGVGGGVFRVARACACSGGLWACDTCQALLPLIEKHGPTVLAWIEKARELLNTLPLDVIEALFGLILCFFGPPAVPDVPCPLVVPGCCSGRSIGAVGPVALRGATQ